MNNNHLKKFDTDAEYFDYIDKDGWVYPSVFLVGSTIVYPKEFTIRLDHRTGQRTYLGNITRDQVREWIKEAFVPVEMNRKTGKVTENPTHEKDEVYFQLVKVKNVNVGIFDNPVEGWVDIRFNFNKGCPIGFHRWFPKEFGLVGRYDITLRLDNSTIDCIAGNKAYWGWSIEKLEEEVNKLNIPGAGLWSYWEQTILIHLMSVISEDQTYFEGTSRDNWPIAGDEVTGSIKSLMGFNDKSYSFMGIEYPVTGPSELYCSGITMDKEGSVTVDLNGDVEIHNVPLFIEKEKTLNVPFWPMSVCPLGFPKVDKGSSTTGPKCIYKFKTEDGAYVTVGSSTNKYEISPHTRVFRHRKAETMTGLRGRLVFR